MSALTAGLLTRSATMNGRVLIVDDLEENRRLLSRCLEREGLQVSTAEDGEQALQRLGAERFDLVMLDLMMPRLDGIQVLERMKADPALRQLPVLMISGVDEIESVVRCIGLGADDYLPKPFQTALLRARVSTCLEKKRLRDQEQAILKELAEERDRSENLLLNILPKSIAERLKRQPAAIADSVAEATVLFADVVGFTAYSAALPPAELVSRLGDIFSAFDALATRHGLEKIKTMGDGYMAVAGVPQPRADHAEAAADMALALAPCLRASGKGDLKLRVGLHSGALVAGVIGQKRFAYDVWGDTVNTASRMESHGIPGRVQVSESTYKLLEGRYAFERRGTIEVKGKGAMNTYLLLGRIH